MSGQLKKLKPIDELKFDSVGEEFIYLHDKISLISSDFIDNSKDITIESLREEYSRIVNEEKVDEKYEKSSVYWSGTQERAIVSFVSEKDLQKKDKIFREDIYKPLKKLVENIIYTYKLFRADVEVRELQEDCMSFLITKMDRYDASKGTRAFAFFGTIAKHYLMGEKKVSYKNMQLNINIEQSSAEYTLDEKNDSKNTEIESEQTNSVVFLEVIRKLELELDNPKMLKNDKKVVEAIVFIFRRHEVINIYNKNLLYHLIKERTGLQTKEVTYSLTRIREFYKNFKQDFLKGLI
tara:strand:- start:1692 stop:2573 length:882 start_codon:yes stop_codon:yes gene_type:complete